MDSAALKTAMVIKHTYNNSSDALYEVTEARYHSIWESSKAIQTHKHTSSPYPPSGNLTPGKS